MSHSLNRLTTATKENLFWTKRAEQKHRFNCNFNIYDAKEESLKYMTEREKKDLKKYNEQVKHDKLQI